MRQLLTLFALLGMASAVPAVAAAADPVVVASESARTPIAAYGGWVVWSHYDDASRSYRLLGSKDLGAPVALPVRSRAVPFDVDLGPGREGRTVAVYSRCRSEVRSHLIRRTYFPPPYRLGRGCALYQVDLERGNETLLLRRRGRSLVEPTIWRDTLAFVVQGREAPDVHVEKRIGRPGRPTYERIPGGRRPHREDNFGGPTGLDLTRGALVMSWRSFADRRCPENPDVRAASSRTQILLHRSGRTSELDRGCDFNPRYARGTIEVGWATFSGSRVYWSRNVSGRGSSVVGRALRSNHRSSLHVDDFAIGSSAVDRGRTYTSASDNRILAFIP